MHLVGVGDSAWALIQGEGHPGSTGCGCHAIRPRGSPLETWLLEVRSAGVNSLKRFVVSCDAAGLSWSPGHFAKASPCDMWGVEEVKRIDSRAVDWVTT
jgi:hypothetical protein